MPEYIERETALKCLKIARGYCPCAYEEIAKLHAADVEPVRHGRWRNHAQGDGRGNYWPVLRCSNCDWREFVKTKYCPNCGAKMDLGEGGA